MIRYYRRLGHNLIQYHNFIKISSFFNKTIPKRANYLVKYLLGIDNFNIVFNTIAKLIFIYLKPFTKKHKYQLCQKSK